MTDPQMGKFIFPTPIQEMRGFTGDPSLFLRIKVNEEIPSHYKDENVVAFLENDNVHTIYTPKSKLTVNVYKKSSKNVFDLNIGNEIGYPESVDINSALNNKSNIIILLTNNKRIQFTNFVWISVYHNS